MITVRFVYLTGIKRALFQNARLVGSWNGWSEIPMASVMGQDGCPAFETKIRFDDGMSGQSVQWGVRLDGPQGANTWGINLEVPDPESQSRTRNLTLPSASAEVLDEYRFTYSRYLGAQKLYAGSIPDLRFTAWAPHAQKVEVVFGKKNHGYISDGGMGIDPDQPVFELIKQAEGVWASAAIPDFDMYAGLPYMFRIVKSGQSKPVMRTDIFSRWQIGRGNQDPAETQWDGDPKSLDGGVSCSVIIDQDLVRTEFEPTSDPPAQISDESFWLTEFTAGNPLPTRVEDVIIYELHVGSLGFGRMDAGNLADAMDLIPYLKDLGVNAVELLPLSESRGTLNWGYGDTHHFVIESSSGGRDKYKHFVRECHRNGIAVIQDVVYNHFDLKAERAEWQYDSDLPEENIYYWYEGRSADYADPTCGYIDNGSSGWAPRYWEEPVRQMFISSAAEFVEEFHVDGFRVDLTQAIHRDNNTQCVRRGIPPILSCSSHSVPNANLYGQKLLREWARTLRMIRPTVMLIAEDHSGWSKVIQSTEVGGLGFDATWYADFYHDLIGDAKAAGGKARLVKEAGYGGDGALAMSRFADSLSRTGQHKIVYAENHDEAGNDPESLRTSKAAVNDAILIGPTRRYAEARSRVAAGLAILSGGTPMFLMGEEILAQRRFLHDDILAGKEDLYGERAGNGSDMFFFYQDLIRLSRTFSAVRSGAIEVVHAHDPTRVIAFTLGDATSQILVAASLNNSAFLDGYIIQTDGHALSSGFWQEIFNSDSSHYGGNNIGNFGAAVPASGGRIELRLPANGFLVLHRT